MPRLLRLSTFACLAAQAAALTTSAASVFRRSPPTCVQRSSTIFALAPGWAEQIDEHTGQTYYYNLQTGETQWETPGGSTTMAGANALRTQWCIDCVNGVAGFSGVAGFAASNKFGDREFRLEYGREGKPCQLPYIVGPGDEQLLSRWNMEQQNQNVARDQCVIKGNSDGSATLVSYGEHNTLVRAAGGQWIQLGPDQEHMLSEGDQIGLDVSNPEGAVFGVSMMAPQSTSVGGAQGGLPAGWYTTVDPESGQTYYCNEQSGVCQWDFPQ